MSSIITWQLKYKTEALVYMDTQFLKRVELDFW